MDIIVQCLLENNEFDTQKWNKNEFTKILVNIKIWNSNNTNNMLLAYLN